MSRKAEAWKQNGSHRLNLEIPIAVWKKAQELGGKLGLLPSQVLRLWLTVGAGAESTDALRAEGGKRR